MDSSDVMSSISLYLQELPNGRRGLVSYISPEITEQQTVFSWVIILHYAARNYNNKDISFIHDIMGETIKAYSAGADPNIVQNVLIVPNNSFLRVKSKK